VGIKVTIKESNFGSLKENSKNCRRELLSVYLCDGSVTDILHALRHVPRKLWRHVLALCIPCITFILIVFVQTEI